MTPSAPVTDIAATTASRDPSSIDPSMRFADARRFLRFSAATIGLAGLAGWLMTLAFHGPGDSSAIRLSALFACVVQIAAFPVVRGLSARNPMIGWASGSLVRFISLPIYAVLVTKVLALPATASLISLFVFYFLSMMIEPYFLRR